MNEPASSNPLGPFKASFGDQQVEAPAPDKGDGDEFGRFTALTDKLLSVPKSEVDAQRKRD